MKESRFAGLAAGMRLWGSLWRVAPARCAAAGGLTVLRAAATIGYVVGLADLVDSLGTSDETPLRPVMVLLASWAVAQISEALRGTVVPGVQAEWTIALTRQGLTYLAADDGLRAADPERRQAAASALDGARSWMGLSSIAALWHALDSRVVGLVGVGLIWSWSPAAAIAVGGAQLFSSRTFTHYLDAIHRDLVAGDSLERRRTQYFRDLLIRSGPAKEVRLFGLSPWLLASHHREWLHGIRAVWDRRDRAARTSYASLGLLAAVTAVSLVLLGRAVLDGSVTAGGAVAALQGLALTTGLGMLGDTLVQVRRAVAVQSAVDALDDSPRAGPTTPCPRCAEHGNRERGRIEMRDVSFSYRGDPEVLSELSLDIRPGEKVAIVGPNGAGKSTLVRLVAGLDAPRTGSLAIDGAPAAAPCPRHRPAVVFQAFARLPATMADNVMLGDLDDTTYEQALRLGGAERLDSRSERVLSTDLPGGRELSGGEWQRVVLSRAFAAVERGAPILVLDEPTSALDVRVERDLFERVLSETSRVTTLLETHRLAGVRRADRIVVLDHGRVRESGTHDELMQADGLYAEMFTLQASLYADDVEVAE